MTPKELGYYMPAEWVRHEATWLTYPKNPDSWPGKIETIYPSYHLFVKTLAECETVHINVDDEQMLHHVRQELEAISTNMQNIRLHVIPSNDAWLTTTIASVRSSLGRIAIRSPTCKPPNT